MAPPDREGAAGLGEAFVAQCSLCCGLQAQSVAPPVPAHSLPPPFLQAVPRTPIHAGIT